MSAPNVSGMPEDYWAWSETGSLIPLGVCGGFDEACERVEQRGITATWIHSRTGLSELAAEIKREMPETAPDLTDGDPKEWSGSLDPVDPSNFWIDDETGERVCAETGERSPPPANYLKDGDYVLTEGSAWLDVKGFSIRVHQTDGGVVVDIFDKEKASTGDFDAALMATTYAYDSDIGGDVEFPPQKPDWGSIGEPS